LLAEGGTAAGTLRILDSSNPGDVEAGAKLTGLGILAILDTPCSLVADVATAPIAFARQHEYPWATWWEFSDAGPFGPFSLERPHFSSENRDSP
jgi:hypothetical protein